MTNNESTNSHNPAKFSWWKPAWRNLTRFYRTKMDFWRSEIRNDHLSINARRKKANEEIMAKQQ